MKYKLRGGARQIIYTVTFKPDWLQATQTKNSLLFSVNIVE